GYKETLVDWPALNARSKFWGDDQRAAFKNWEEITNLHSPPKGIAENIQRRELLRRILMKVIQENKLDVLIQLHTALPPGRIGLHRTRTSTVARSPIRSDRTPASQRSRSPPATCRRPTIRSSSSSPTPKGGRSIAASPAPSRRRSHRPVYRSR